MKERLQKLLAQANIASRRASEDLITRGRVRVNGALAHVGDKADPAVDVIEVDGTRLNFAQRERLFIALNKPKYVLTTDKPHRHDKRTTVMELIDRDEHLFSIGRLDADSEGLVVMTNDGDTAQRLSHPRYRHSKTYRVEVYGLPTAETLEKWAEGIFLEEGKAAPCFIEITKGSVKGSTLRIIMTEGKKRQIRRVAAALGHQVERLVRTHIGMFALGDLAPGETHTLNPKEILALGTPAPEIKALRSQSRRALAKRGAAAPADTEAPADPARRPLRGQKPAAPAASSADEPRRTSRVKPSASTDENRRTGRFKKSDSADDTLEKRRTPRAARSASPEGQPDQRRTRRSDQSDSGEGKDEKRRAPRIRSTVDVGKRRAPTIARPVPTDAEAGQSRPPRFRKSDSPGDPQEKRRAPRIRKSDAPAEEQDRRRTPRAQTSGAPDRSSDEKRRAPRSKPAAASDTSSDEKRRTPRSKPSGAPKSDKRPTSRVKKSRTPDKKRGTGAPRKQGNRKPGNRKGTTR
ncbi:MAG: pseudouridine synthase [Chloroflexota bacterium]